MVGLQVNFLWSSHSHWLLWPTNDEQKWWMSLSVEALKTCLWFSTSSFLSQWCWKYIWGWSLRHPVSLSNSEEKSFPINPHWTCRVWNNILFFNTLCFVGVVCYTSISCLTLSDREQLYNFGRLKKTCHFSILQGTEMSVMGDAISFRIS